MANSKITAVIIISKKRLTRGALLKDFQIVLYENYLKLQHNIEQDTVQEKRDVMKRVVENTTRY